MIDITNLQQNTTHECSLFELPPIIRDKVSLHLFYKEEKPLLCTVTQFGMKLETYVLTTRRIVRVRVIVDKKTIIDIRTGSFLGVDDDVSDISILIRDIMGFEHWKRKELSSIEYRLNILHRSHNLSLSFFSEEVFLKFSRMICSCFNENNQ